MTDVLVTVLAALIGLAAGWLFSGRIEAESEAPVRPVWPALATGALSAAAAWHAGATWSAPVYVYFAVVSIPLAVVDLRTHRLPNAWTLTAYPLVAVGLLLPSAVAGSWSDLGRAVAGGGILLGVYLLLHLVNPSGMGLGDVKLSGPMGALLAWLSWSVLLVGTFLGFALGAVVGLGLMAVGRAGRKSALPFGPFMLAGAWIAILASAWVDALDLLPF
jgi:leader peptidase (prepilin peptidase) / N-methyltransferase